MKSIKFLLPLAALALSGTAAAGTPLRESVVVPYGDLNLDSREELSACTGAFAMPPSPSAATSIRASWVCARCTRIVSRKP